MNDYSAIIFNRVRDAVSKKYPKCRCTSSVTAGKKVELPALLVSFAFPSEDTDLADSSGEEVWTRTVCTAEAYSGTSQYEAKGILKTADEAMRSIGFRRSNYTEVPNVDKSVRRFQITWRAKADRHGNIANW